MIVTAKLDTYLNYIRTTIAQSVPFRRGDEISLQVEIDGGLHKGSRTTLSRKQIVIGSAPTNDIMLLDDEIADGIVTFEPETSILGPMINVSTGRTDVTVAGVNITDPKGIQTFLLPCTVDIGDLPIHLSAERNNPTNRLSVPEFAAILALLWAGILGLGFASNWGQPTESNFMLVAGEQSDPRLPQRDEDPQRVTAMLQTAGLSEYLSVVPKSENALAVVGSLPTDMKDQWLSVRRELDTMSDRLVVFSEFQERASRPPIPAIALVRLGEDPALIFADDTVARVGDALGEGWSIDVIAETEFSISRHGKGLTISYQ